MTPKLIWYIIALLMIVVATAIARLPPITHILSPEYFDVNEYPDYSDVIDDRLDAHHPAVFANIYQAHAVESSPTPRDYDLLKPLFAWAPADTITRTLTVTTQYA
jgi:hypothetical protein